MRIRPHSIGFRALKNVRLRFFGISTTRYKIQDGPIGSENPEASERNHFWTSEVEKMKEKEISESFEKAVVDYGSKLDSEENLLKQFMSKAYRTEMEAFLADSGTFLVFYTYKANQESTNRSARNFPNLIGPVQFGILK